MTDKHCADERIEAFQRFWQKSVFRNDTPPGSAIAAWNAAWEAKQAADVKAVEDYAADRGNYSAGMNERFNAGVTVTCDGIKRRITGEKE